MSITLSVLGLLAAPPREGPGQGVALEAPLLRPAGAASPRASAAARAGSVLQLEGPLPAMVRIPAGNFVMGSDESDVLAALGDCAREPYGNRCDPSFFTDELPQRLVSLSSYWLDRFEVRVADYERCVSIGRCRARPLSAGTRRYEAPDLPVSLVSWDDARTYCELRGARLPTEAEFERAARGPRARRYPWGELFNRRALNHGRRGWDMTDDTDGFAELAPVGSFPAGVTPEGIHDLAGNVGEWIQDRYVPRYDPGERQDPQGPGVGVTNVRVTRGGDYRTSRAFLRGAARSYAEPSARWPTLGFRCARSEAAR